MESGTLLLLAGASSPPPETIPESWTIRRAALDGARDFPKIPSGVSLVLIDLDSGRNHLEQVLALRAYSLLNEIPVWGISGTRNIKRDRLFLSFGGDEIVRKADLASRLDHEKGKLSGIGQNPGQSSYLPSLSRDAMDRRLMEQYHLAMMEQKAADLQRKEISFDQSMEGFLDILYSLIRPHIIILLINDNQRAKGYIRPSSLIFEQDYQDFLNFCLNDFYNHFQGINLEDIEEHFILRGRKDFSKLNIRHQKLSSYVYFPLTNREGSVEATLHLGHLRNNYFSERQTVMIQRFINAGGGSFFFKLRDYQNGIRQRKILNIFSRFVPSEIIPELVRKERSRENEKAEKREITILFSDIRSFTTITEQNEAQEVVDFLNRHFEIMVGCIKRHGGTIDKFIGDAIVAMFGVPVPFEDSSSRAVKAAVEMISSLPKVDCRGLALPQGNYGIGIGLHVGDAIIGNVGSDDKSDFTAIGDVISIAEELEAITKKYPSPIIMSDRVHEQVSHEIPTLLVDAVSLGKEEKIELYAPLSTWEGDR